MIINTIIRTESIMIMLHN